ncbi:MAG: BBP7 family outer membrane beta-barrel protein [Pirellulaceae bacterium]
MKKLLLSLSLAGLCLSQASAQAPQSSRHIGDGGPIAAVDQRPEAFRASNARLVSQSSALDYEMLAPTSADYESIYEPSNFSSSSSCGCSSGSCGGGSACGSVGGSCGGARLPKTWISAESLLWFAGNQRSPVLATTSAQGVLPVSGEPGVTDAFGGGAGLDAGLLPGFRLSGGTYFGDCDKIGVGGRAFGIFSNANEYNATSGGVPSLGIPFFNVAGQPNPFNDAYLVAFTSGGGTPVSEGSIDIRSDLDMIGAEGSLYLLLGRSANHRVDLVGGYTFNKLKNSVSVHTQSIDRFTGNLIPDGTVFDTNDLFATENVFNGGHIGLLSTVVRSRLSLSTLSKVSFGNMRQSGAITGTTDQDDGTTAQTFMGGLFAQQSNIGTFSRDTFAFIPELGVKLGYSFRPNVQLTAGYTFMMWSSVGMAGDQIDSSLDLTQVNGAAGARPMPLFRDTTFWMQGVDLGLNWTY